MTWLEAAFTSVILKIGMTLCLSLTTYFPPYNRPDWENALHEMLSLNPTLRLSNRTTYFTTTGYIVEHTFISINNI